LDRSLFEDQEEEIPDEILEKSRARDAAKAEKDYALADSLRDEIQHAGYKVIDTKEGTIVERV